MTGDDGIPRIDGPDVPEDAFDSIDVADVSPADYSDAAESLTRSFDHDVAKAVASAMWHTIIDGAGSEAFVDALSVDDLREAIHRLQENGYATERISPEEVYATDSDDPEDTPDGAAFFVGDDAGDAYDALADDMVRLGDDDVDATGDRLPSIDGYIVERSPALPSNLVVLVDVDAIARIPAEARSVPVGLDTAASVSSPIVVRDEAGIAVVNVADTNAEN